MSPEKTPDRTESQALQVILQRFRPIPGNAQFAGDWEASFRAPNGEGSFSILDTNIVKSLLVKAGVPEAAIHIGLPERTDITSVRASSVRVEHDGFEIFQGYVEAQLPVKGAAR